ncbi:MAG: cytochrome c [Saprospiraceae bacterium]|nr:cytochrome c [Saprospiraceae bacterium]
MKAPFEDFTVRCGVDTTVVLKNRFKIQFKAGSLACDGHETVNVRLNYLMRTEDIVLARMHTRDAQGRLMESGGMFKLEFPGGQRINPNQPVTVTVPADFTDNDMSLYTMRDVEEGWTSADKKPLVPDQTDIAEGETLFRKNCIDCHCKYLRDNMTGPALGNIHLFRDSAWLVRYTRNSMAMIEKGDALATCLWERWKPTLMPNYDSLTEVQIAAIYRYLRNESARLDIQPDEVFFPVDCERTIVTPTTDTTRRGTVVATTTYSGYVVEVEDDEWINIDKVLYLNRRIDPILVHVEPKRGTETSVFVALPHRKVVAFCYELRTGLFSNNFSSEPVPFFVDEPVIITAARYDAKTQKLLEFETATYVTRKTNNEVHFNNYRAADEKAFVQAFKNQRENIARRGPRCEGHVGQ